MQSTQITLADGSLVHLELGGNGLRLKQKPANFEVVMCERDSLGNRLNSKKTVYRGDHAPAVEATFLKQLSEVEKAHDVYAVPVEV